MYNSSGNIFLGWQVTVNKGLGCQFSTLVTPSLEEVKQLFTPWVAVHPIQLTLFWVEFRFAPTCCVLNGLLWSHLQKVFLGSVSLSSALVSAGSGEILWEVAFTTSSRLPMSDVLTWQRATLLILTGSWGFQVWGTGQKEGLKITPVHQVCLSVFWGC